MGRKIYMEPDFASSEIDTTKPHPARLYNFYLGGQDNYAVDRAAAEEMLRVVPESRDIARANRAFLQRAVRFLAGEVGIEQFIDIGTGIPAAGSVHEVAHRINPDARIAYADNDPVVHVHASTLLADQPNAGIVLADLRDPGLILSHPKVGELIDFGKPVGLLLLRAPRSPWRRSGQRVLRRLGGHRPGRRPSAVVAARRRAAASAGPGEDRDLHRSRAASRLVAANTVSWLP
jgi:hypothetical protein